MTREINWHRPTSFLGRNGLFTCLGLLIEYTSDMDDAVCIQPVTSRGLVARCSVAIPVEAIENLVAALQEARARIIKDMARRSSPPGHENCPGCVNCGRGLSNR